MKKSILHRKGVSSRQRAEHQGKYADASLLTEKDYDRLSWAVSEDLGFLSEIEDVVADAIEPGATFSAKDNIQAYKPGLIHSRALLDLMTDPDTGLWFTGHSTLKESLETFINEIETSVKSLEAQPPKKKPKNVFAYRTVKRIDRVFRKYDLAPTTYDDGPFSETVRVVFASANRIKPGSMPKSTKNIILDVLG